MSLNKKILSLVVVCVVCVMGSCGLLVSVVLVSKALKSAQIRTVCEVGGQTSNQCVFTNTHRYAGSACVTVRLTHRRTRNTLISQPVCSGELAARSTITAPVVFARSNVRAFCGRNTGANCTMRALSR